jgi:hypothetical protein
MDDQPLPSELQRLERDLRARPLPAASDGLRERILDSLQARVKTEESRSRWQFAAAVAATVLLWMNLSMSATQATDFGLGPREARKSVEEITQQIQQLVPEFSRDEARHRALLLHAGSQSPGHN